MAMRRGGTGAWCRETTHIPVSGVRERGQPLGTAVETPVIAPDARCNAHMPVFRPARQEDGSRVASSRMETPKRGTETGLNDQRKLVNNCGTVPCPGRSPLPKRRDRESAWSNHGRNPPRERGGVSYEELWSKPLTNCGQGFTGVHPAFVSSPARGEVGCHALGLRLGRGGAAGLPLPLRERI